MKQTIESRLAEMLIGPSSPFYEEVSEELREGKVVACVRMGNSTKSRAFDPADSWENVRLLAQALCQ